MRSVFDLLLVIGCVFFPKAALGVVVPVYVYRAPPTLSPSSSPSSQPSSRPSSQPTTNPSSSPSNKPSSDPTSNPSISRNPSLSTSTNPESSSVSSSFMMNPEAMSKPSSLGLKLSMSLICILLFFVGAWFHFVQKKKKKQCLPCFVTRGDKTSQDKMQDKVQEQEKQNDADALPPAEGDNDGWTGVLSPVLVVGRFLSSMVSPAPPQEEPSLEEEPSNPPSPVVKKGRFLSSLVSSARPRAELSSEEPSNPPSPVGKKKSSSLLNLKRSNAQAVSRGSFSISTKKSKKWQHVAC